MPPLVSWWEENFPLCTNAKLHIETGHLKKKTKQNEQQQNPKNKHRKRTTHKETIQTNSFSFGSPLLNFLVVSAVQEKPPQFSKVFHSACPPISSLKMGMWNPAPLWQNQPLVASAAASDSPAECSTELWQTTMSKRKLKPTWSFAIWNNSSSKNDQKQDIRAGKASLFQKTNYRQFYFHHRKVQNQNTAVHIFTLILPKGITKGLGFAQIPTFGKAW